MRAASAYHRRLRVNARGDGTVAGGALCKCKFFFFTH